MFEAIALLLSILLLFFNYTVNKDIFYPPALFSLVWTIVLIAYIIFRSMNQGDAYTLDGRSLFIFIVGEITFTAGGLFAVNRKLTEQKIKLSDGFKFSFDVLIFFFLLIMLPLYVKKLFDIVGSSTITDGNFFIVLRYEFVQNNADIGVLKYLNSLAIFGFAINLYKYNFTTQKAVSWPQKLYKYAFYLLVITYSALTTGRTYFLFLFALYIGYKMIAGKLKTKHYVSAVFLFFTIFGAIAIILRKAGGEEMTVSENIASVFQSILTYFLGGIYAFDHFIREGYNAEFGENTFRFFIAILHSLGVIDKEPKDLVMEFINYPVLSNVYSLYYIYIKDFWYFGLIFNALWSFLHCWFYYRAKANFFYLFMYAALLFPLIMSFFQDQYVSLLSTWIQLILFAFVAGLFVKKKPEKSNNTLVSVT